MKNLIQNLIISYFIFSGISYISDFNYDTGLALISKNAHKATITSMDKYEDRIYAIGVHGIILYSDDNGEKWTQSELVPFKNTLTDIECVSKSQCWAIGHDALILHTTDVLSLGLNQPYFLSFEHSFSSLCSEVYESKTDSYPSPLRPLFHIHDRTAHDS